MWIFFCFCLLANAGMAFCSDRDATRLKTRPDCALRSATVKVGGVVSSVVPCVVPSVVPALVYSFGSFLYKNVPNFRAQKDQFEGRQIWKPKSTSLLDRN